MPSLPDVVAVGVSLDGLALAEAVAVRVAFSSLCSRSSMLSMRLSTGGGSDEPASCPETGATAAANNKVNPRVRKQLVFMLHLMSVVLTKRGCQWLRLVVRPRFRLRCGERRLLPER